MILRLLAVAAAWCFSVPMGAVELQSCQITIPFSPNAVDARCAAVVRPENPADAEGESIAVQVAVLSALTDKAEPDPVFVLAGGPGQSAIDLMVQQTGNFSQLLQRRDVVFVDQRGTGRSNPMTCAVDDVASLLVDDLATAGMVSDCLDTLPGDPRYYTTAQAVADLEGIRLALGYGKINLLGYSYGTRVAQEYLRAYPESVRSMVLDGVAPPTENLGSKHSQNLTRVIEALIADCEASAPCNAAFPDLRDDFATYLAIDPHRSRSLTIRHPISGDWQTLDADRGAMDVALRLFSYHPVTQAMIPILLHQVATGDWRTVMSHAILVSDRMEGMIAMGMHNSVICSEDMRHWSPDPDQPEGALIGDLDEALAAMCALWPVGASNPLIHEPMVSALPVLLLSGERDPVTPPDFAEQALQQFSNGQHIVGLGLGHVVSTEPCFERIVAKFVETLDVSDEDGRCANRRWGFPPVTSLSGPAL